MGVIGKRTVSDDEISVCQANQEAAGSMFSPVASLSHYSSDRWHLNPRGKGLICLRHTAVTDLGWAEGETRMIVISSSCTAHVSRVRGEKIKTKSL